MVVVTEYDFDAGAWRAAAGHGPEVLAVEVGTGGYDWSKLPLAPARSSCAPAARPASPASSSKATASPSRSATSSSSSARRRDRQRAAPRPSRSRATWSARFVMSTSDAPPWMPRSTAASTRSISPARSRQASSCARGAITIPSSSAEHEVAGRHAHAAEQDRPADARRDVAAARHRDRPARPQRQLGRQPGAVAHVAVDDDPAEAAAQGLGRQQLAERGQRRAAGLHDEHVARRRLADRVQHREELARRDDRVGRPEELARVRQRPDRRDRRRAATCRRHRAC